MGKSIGFIGAGNMGGAIIRGLLAAGLNKDETIIVSDPRQEVLEDLRAEFPGIQTSSSNRDAAKSDFLILAVKPQIYQAIIAEVSGDLEKDTVVVSIAAGITLDSMAGWMGVDTKIVRTMPNTPALVSAGITALCPASNVSQSELEAVTTVFEVVGQTVVLPEHLMDAFTALAGSSPAWVFMFIEALADGAVREGIPRAVAYQAASQAVLGSAKLILETNAHPAKLKDQVCSPGGTTIAGVAALENAGFRSAIIKAVHDCTRRGMELGGK